MHSSRIRTGRSLTVCCSLIPGGGGCLLRGVSAPGGCLVWGGCLLWGSAWSRGVSARGCLVQRGVCSRGVSALGGCLVWRGAWSRAGVSGPGGVSQHALRQTPSPLPVDRILDTRLWKYYLGPTSLRPVKSVHLLLGKKEKLTALETIEWS